MSGLLVENNDRGIFNIEIFIKCGSIYENKNENGLSHLLEHMMFKSKNDKDVEQILLELNSLGGIFNATTSKDYTCFYIQTIENNWKKSVNILSKIVFDPVFKSNELENEKKVVIEEFLQVQDDTQKDIFEKAYKLFLHHKNPYRKSVKGSLKNIKNTTPHLLKQFYLKHYSTCLVYANCSPNISEKVTSYLKNTFRHRLNTLIPTSFHTDELVNITLLPVIKLIKSNSAQNSTIIMFKGFPYKSKNNIVLELVWDLLAGSLNSLLMMEMREKRGLVYGVTAFNDTFAHLGITGLYFTSSTTDIKSAILYILKILKKIKNKGISKNILTYSKASFINKLQYRSTDLNYAIQRNMMCHYYGCEWNEKKVISKLRKITNTDIIEVCKSVFNFNKMCIVSMGHYKSPDTLEKKIRKIIIDLD